MSGHNQQQSLQGLPPRGPWGRGPVSPFRPASPFGLTSPPPSGVSVRRMEGSPMSPMFGMPRMIPGLMPGMAPTPPPAFIPCPRPRWPASTQPNAAIPASPLPYGFASPTPMQMPMSPPFEYFYSPYDVEYVGMPLEPGEAEVDVHQQAPSTASIIASQSQDYVDEKLAEYQATIQQLQDEQERVQKKTFVNWINSYLGKRTPPMKIDDLIEDLKDGTNLLALLEVLSGEKLPVERGRNLKRPHFLSNVNTALQFLLSKKIKLVNINASDLVDGRPPVVLGLIWTIILYFQIEENTRALESLGQAFGGSTSSLENMRPKSSASEGRSEGKRVHGARHALMQWVTNALPKGLGIEIRDFGASWRDGVAFLGIIDAIKSNLVNISSLKHSSNKIRLETAFEVAENELGIARLLDPEDVDVPRPDEKSIMTYVAQFLHKYPEPRNPSGILGSLEDTYNEFISWLLQKTQYLEHLQQTNSLPDQYEEYAKLKNEVDNKHSTLEHLKSLVESQSMIGVTKESWNETNGLWNKLNLQLQLWLRFLDSKLPGDLRTVGEWLAKAETIITSDDIPTAMNEETASIISYKLEEHKVVFADYPMIKNKFEESRNAYAQNVNPHHLQHMAHRLEVIGPLAARRRIKLKFLEHKCCLIAFLHLTETKLRGWTVKYGREEKVQQLLEQYRNFVSRNRIFQEFNKAFLDMQKVIDEYKQEGNVDQQESIHIDRFLRDTGERWKNVSMELRCVQSMLEEVVAYWRRWNTLSDEFESWLDRAYGMLDLPEEDKMEYFQDVSVWKDKYQLLGDTVSFLIATCEDQVACELKEQSAHISTRWKDLFQHVKQYMHAGDILRNRKEYRRGLESVQQWLHSAEMVLSTSHLNNTETIKAYGQQLQQLQNEVETIEEIFKNVSKIFQSMIQDLSREEVDRMMNTLKKEKEGLVRVRALIPMQLHLFHQILVQQESLEVGKREINQWLSEAESLLSSFSITGDRDNVQNQLEKHKSFFSRLLYYKSMLDSKNKVFQSIVKSVDSTDGVDSTDYSRSMTKLNERFATTTQNAIMWEQKFQEVLRCWNKFREAELLVNDWLLNAEKLLTEKHADKMQVLHTHKEFFKEANEHWIQGLINAGRDLHSCLPPEHHLPITAKVEEVQTKWKEILSLAPLHLMHLEFGLNETNFNNYLKDVEKELSAEHQAFNKHEDVNTILSRHVVFFESGTTLQNLKECLDSMKKLSDSYKLKNPNDFSLQNAYSKAENMWKNLSQRISEFRKQLQQIPLQWKDYKSKFVEMVQWMDLVDVSLKTIEQEVKSFEEFEKERYVFQEICRDVDNKREDMKWLVQTLDALVSHCSDEESLREQQDMEQLIIRYKNLIPTIELTLVKTEVHNKCYIYLKEVREVCDLLQKVKETSMGGPNPETLDAVNLLVKQQESAVVQLDQQRSNILSMLQRGKDLMRDNNAPTFMKPEVTNLEASWNDAYRHTVDKLNNLKDTQKMWNSYKEQKGELLKLLDQAERALCEVVPLNSENQHLADDLGEKHALKAALHEARNIKIQHLQNQCVSLTSVTSPDRKPIFEKEVFDIERRLQGTIKMMEEHVGHLEHCKSQWMNFNGQLKELGIWTQQTAPALLDQLEMKDQSPEECMNNALKFENEIKGKVALLNKLMQDSRTLLPVCSDMDKRQIQTTMAGLQNSLLALQQTVEMKKSSFNNEMASWQECQDSIQAVKGWIEQAEIKSTRGLQKPGSLPEAHRLQHEAKLFEMECEEVSSNLQKINALNQQLTTSGSSANDIVALQTRWTSVCNDSNSRSSTLNKLIDTWEKLEAEKQKLNIWINEIEAFLREPMLINTLDVEQLEKQSAKLQLLSQAVSEKQANITELTHLSESILPIITSEGAAAVKIGISEIKSRLNNVAESIRDLSNSTSDTILVRREFDEKFDSLTEWIDRLENDISQVSAIELGKVDSAFQNVLDLLQEHSEKQIIFNALLDEVTALSSSISNQDELASLNNKYSSIASKYQDLQTFLEGKKLSLEKWSGLLIWHGDTMDFMRHIQYQLDTQKCSSDELKSMTTDLDNICSKLNVWQPVAAEIDFESRKHKIQIKDVKSGKVLSPTDLVRDVQALVNVLQQRLNEKHIVLEEVSNRLSHFHHLENELSNELLSALEAAQKLLSSVTCGSELEEAFKNFSSLLEEHQLRMGMKNDIHGDGKILMEQDQTSVEAIQNILASVDRKWDNINETLKDQKSKLYEITKAWKHFNECKENVLSDVKEIADKLSVKEDINDITIATRKLDEAKKALELLARLKINLDTMDSKCQFIIKQTDLLPNLNVSELKKDLQDVLAFWHDTHDKAAKYEQNFEAQLIIWKQIEDSRIELNNWLQETSSTLSDTLNNLIDVSNSLAHLNRFKDELPTYYNIKASIATKSSQIVKLNNGKPIPTLDALNTLLEDQFAYLTGIANKLEDVASTFNEQEKIICEDMKKASDYITHIRESIIKCDDLTGENHKIIERLQKCQISKQELTGLHSNLEALKEKIEKVKVNYPLFSNSGLVKELASLEKRFNGVLSHASKVETTLLTFLKKYHMEKYSALERVLATYNEKVTWCIPEANSDLYNLDSKLSSLEDVSAGLSDCDAKHDELNQSLLLLQNVESPENMEQLFADRNILTAELDALKENYNKTKESLNYNIELWRKYEIISEEVSSWLQNTESKIRSENISQINIAVISDKITEMDEFCKNVINFQEKVKSLIDIGEEISKKNPESRIAQPGHLLSRYQSVLKFATSHVERLKNLELTKNSYRSAVEEVESWLAEANEKLKSLEDLISSPAKPVQMYQNKFEELKSFAEEREKGQSLLNKAVEVGDALISGIATQDREAIRTELRALRDASELLIDKSNAINKKVEVMMMQRSSFDESYGQVKKWISEVEAKLGDKLNLTSDLKEKKQSLYAYRLLAQDVYSHENVMKQLQNKIESLQDSDATTKFNVILESYKNLSQTVEDRIKIAEKQVLDHEAYLKALEKSHDWLLALSAEASVVFEDSSLEKEGADAKLVLIDDLLNQKEEANKLIDSCHKFLQIVLEQTDISGHPVLLKQFEEQKQAWESFFDKCADTKQRVQSLHRQWSDFEEVLDSLNNWMKTKECQVKDQSLRSTQEAKQLHLDKLKTIEEEIISKSTEFSDVFSQSQTIIGKSELSMKVSCLNTRYQALKNITKEAVSKYEEYVSEHCLFNQEYNSILDWLSQVELQLKDYSQIVGDISVLQERQKKIRELSDLRSKESVRFERLIDNGEKLYAHTSPDGREIIRQQLRTLRTLGDNFSDDLQAAMHKLDQCLMQFAEFTLSQEQLTKWLKDVERAMTQHTELKSSLQEKRAQLQNHKIMHQEIMSHQQLVESVCDKAQQLVDQTQDKSLNIYLQSIKQLFQDIVLKSQDLLNDLEECSQKHNHFSTLCKNYHSWIISEQENLRDNDDVSGEKGDVLKRLSTLQNLRDNCQEKVKEMTQLQELCGVVSKGTAPKGVQALQKEVDDLHVAFSQHLQKIANVENKLSETIKQWEEFEKQLDHHTKWFRNIESVFREQQLQDSLQQKEVQLQNFQKKRDLITEQEKTIDEFVDRSHALLNSSGADRIKPLISQISNRYQLLHVLSKEVINRWQSLVEDHRVYDEKLQETLEWLVPLESNLDNLLAEGVSRDLKSKDNRLHVLLAEQQQGFQRIENITALGERLFPDTSAPGREKIRNDIRDLRDRWDKLQESIKDQQKRHDAQSLQWSSYQETLQQTLAWLDSMERTLAHDTFSSWSSPQEIRSKLLKYKTMLQEVITHKRVIEAVTEKAHAVLQLSGCKPSEEHEVLKTVEQINKRYESLVNNLLVMITQLEESLDAFQQFHDLQKLYQDYQKQLWDSLATYTDYSGAKSALQSRLEKVKEIKESLNTEGQVKLKALADLVSTKNEKLPPRAKEVMERDLGNLKFDYEKLVSALNDVIYALDDRLKQWSEYEGSYDRLLEWLSESEATLKNYSPRSTLKEKQEQLEKFQVLIHGVRKIESEVDKMSDESSELAQMSGETRVSVSVQQIISRFQSIHATAKEVLKKCEQAASDHEAYLEKYQQCSAWLATAQSCYESCSDGGNIGAREDLLLRSSGLKELLAQQSSAISLLSTTVELGEKLYPTTALEGREIVRQQIQEIQHAMEALFDGVSSTERELQAKLLRWIGFEECSENLRQWLSVAESHLPAELVLKTTLDEKRAQLQSYRALLHDALTHQQDIVCLRDKSESLPERSGKIEKELNELTERHADILRKAQNFVERYEAIVSDHQQYSKAVMDTQEWLEATHNTVLLWGDTELERISLHTNLERLKNLQHTLPEEEIRIKQIRSLGEKVIPSTVETGQINIRSQVDSSQQEWESLLSAVRSVIEALETKLQHWNEYEVLKDQCLRWIRETDTKLHAVDLKETAEDKKKQLQALKVLQGEVRAKELEIDALTERAQQLYKGSLSTRSSLISELGLKYQQVSHKVKDLATRWHQYVVSHEEFDNCIAECTQWLEDIKNKLTYCSDLSASSQKDLESKMETIQDLLLYKEEGFTKVQSIVEMAQIVLANTAPSGHGAINLKLGEVQEEWSVLASKMLEIKAILDDSLQRWAGFLEQIHQLNKTVEYLESVSNEMSEFQATMAEKRNQLERIKCLEEKVRCEKIEVDSLKAKAAEMLASGQQSHAASQAQEVLNKFDILSEKIKNILSEREDQYKDHRLYKEAYDDLIGWLSRAREKMPSMKQRSLSDKIAIENSVAPLEALLNKQAQGELLVEHLQHTGEVVMASTSPAGQETIRNEIQVLRENFECLFKEIKEQKDQLEAIVIQWRDYKEEYEKLSDWLQQIDILVKAQKTALLATVEEKGKQVKEVKDILDRLEKGQGNIDRFNETASVLLTSHLDTYISNQLRHLNSRYQVQVNLAKDVLKKVETNHEQHTEYNDYLGKAKNWIENAKQVIWDCSQASSTSTHEELQARLEQIQELLRKREDGQNLVHMTVNCGEKVLRNTRSDGRDVINSQLKDLQVEWDRVVRKISTAKVHLETSLLQWADYSSSYIQLQQWITDREAKLQQVCEQKVSKAKKGHVPGLSALSIGERRATLRQTSSIVQDIVSFEPMIQSVTSKVGDLLQSQPASEISSKYETLSKHAKELYEKQKETVEQHQAFIDAGNDFMQWIRASKEKLSKCSEPTGDKESLSSKVMQLKVLQSAQDEGQQKLEKALEQGNVACQVADEEDKEVIEEEVALLQEEFDTYNESLNLTKNLLEIGIVKWTEYEDHYQVASDWLTQTEQHVQSYNKLQDSLEEKKNVLEEFQVHLQTLFDWQKELDRLNMKAQVLLETCADSRISNAVTQMTTKYNALLSLAKEIMRRLELHYQEHQQHNTLYQECQDWVDRTRDKLHECQEVPNSFSDVNNKVATVKGIRQSLEQGQNKLRYVLELKEKVILNTEQNGAAKIQEDTENLKLEFEKLMVDVQDLRQKLAAQATHLEEIHKAQKLLLEWLDEVEQKIQNNDGGEQRTLLEKFKNIQRDINCHTEMVDRLKARVAEVQLVPTKEYESCVQKYQSLKELVSQNIEMLDQQVSKHELYKQAYTNALDWLRKTRIDIQQCSDSHGEKVVIERKSAKMSEIEKKFPEGQNLLDVASDLSSTIMNSVSLETQDSLRHDIQQLKTDWQNLQVLRNETQKILTKCIASWNDFNDTYKTMKNWLEEFQSKVSAENEEEKKTPEELQKCRSLLQEATQQKVLMEGLNDRCEVLMELSACSWVRDKTVELQGIYSNLLTSLQVLISRSEKNLSDHTEFLKAKEEVDLWLKTAHGTVQDCIGVGDETVTREKLETIQLVSTRMTEGQHLMSILQDVFAKAINTAPSEHQDTLREDIAQLRNSWDQLNMDLTSVMAQLKAALSRWEEYGEQKSRLEKWMQSIETTLKQAPDTKGELGEMKTLMERFKHIQADVNSKHTDLEHLLTEACELTAWASQPTVLEEVRKLQTRWDYLSQQCITCREAMELEIKEYTAYHNSLQNTEKWILQTSFTLMAHNSLYITNKQQTTEQIQQHESLLEDIQKYQVVLDDIQAKGHGQIKRYLNSTPSLEDIITKQLNNVQDSYNSLLHTAIQIKKRLMESLAKFEEYEETLESIKNNMDGYEQIISRDTETPTTLAGIQQKLEATRDLHNKLQGEKSRLAIAVQACEAAAACISRPSSPQDTMPPPIPDNELMVRARLEDFIDQIQSRMTLLTNLLGEMEESQRYFASLQQWIDKSSILVQEWNSKPLKLRPEAALVEQQAMKDLEAAIQERLLKLRSELPQTEENNRLQEQLGQLETKLSGVCAKKNSGQQIVEEFKQKVNDTLLSFDDLSKQMEEIDKGNGLDCAQKISALNEIERKFNDQLSSKVEEVKQLAGKVMDITNNLDAQQVEEQVKSVERRCSDITKKIQRKSQVFNMTRKGLESANQEIDSARGWMQEKLAEIRNPPPLGFESKVAEERLLTIKSLMKEVEGKKVLLETIERRLSNLQAELEPNELQIMESQIISLTTEHNNLLKALKSEQERIASAAEGRRKLELNIDAARNWLKTKTAEVKKFGGHSPLLVSALEAEYKHLKQLESDIKLFHTNTISEIVKQVNTIEKDCSEPEKEKLKKNLQDLLKEYDTLNDVVNKECISLGEVLNSRKLFETEMKDIKHWLNEAEVATSVEIRFSNMELLEEQFTKYDKLNNESDNIKTKIENVTLKAKNILPLVSEVDKLTLSEDINAIKEKHSRINSIIRDRSETLQGQLKQYKEAAVKISESVQFMTQIQEELKDLNRPISSKIEDVQGMLQSYEKILADLKANKSKLGDLQVGNISELQGISLQQNELIQSIEAQIARLRQLLLLREQFIGLITEIMTFITKYTEVVRDIEKKGHTVEEKIRKYDDVIVKIQECEALLASATDKGQQIGAEGSVADRNSITEQLQSLKQSLQALRRAVEKQREQHEITLAEHKKIAAKLEEILLWLHANETSVRSRPLLSRDASSVGEEINKHKELAALVKTYLDRIRSVQESVQHDEGIPGSLLEKLSEANSLLNILPAELEERLKYLEKNMTLRTDYAGLKERLRSWIHDAEVRLNANAKKINFDNIAQELQDHKAFFGSEASMRELVSQNIQQVADSIWPSLSAPEQESLSQEQQNLAQDLKNMLNLAKSKQVLLEQNIEIWQDFCNIRDKIQLMLDRIQFKDEPGCSLGSLQFSIQKIVHASTDAQNLQKEIDLLKERAKELKQHADKPSIEKIDTSVDNMNTLLTNCLLDLDNRKENLQKLFVEWEEFEKQLQNMTAMVFSYEEKVRHVETFVRSKTQITEVKTMLETLMEEIQSIDSIHQNILSLSTPILNYLKNSSGTSSKDMEDKVNHVSNSYEQLKKSVNNKLMEVNKNLEQLDNIMKRISKLQEILNPLPMEIQQFDEFDASWEQKLKDLSTRIKDAVKSTKEFITSTKEQYSACNQSTPSDVVQEMSALELTAETISSAMEDRERQVNRIRSLYDEYKILTTEVSEWLPLAESRIKDRSALPQDIRDTLSQIQGELSSVSEKLERITRCGNLLLEKIQNEKERSLIQNTISSLTEQYLQIKTSLEERKEQIGNTLDAWQNFEALHNTVQMWITEKEAFLSEPLHLSSLSEARQKLQDYSTTVKSCKTINKHVQDMSKALELIEQNCSVGDLSDKLEEISEAKGNVESQVLERNALLQETSEEWEQCEKKMKEVKSWIEKSRQNLESPLYKKKPLRDQLTMREKMMSDIAIQKTKISISVEKLQVHFRSGIGGDSKVTELSEKLIEELDQLLSTIKEQSAQLEICLSQLEQYQQEIQQLRQQIVQVEQQLRVVLSPTYSPNDSEKALEEQNACRECALALQTKISARLERIKLLTQRGTPDVEPFDL